MPPASTHRHRDVESAPGDAAFLRAFAATFAALALGLAALVRLTDPLAAFGGGIFPPVVSADRDYKASLYRKAPVRPRVVVLGSSRVKALRPACIAELTGRPAFNFGVNAGVAEDFVAILRFVQSDSASAVREVLLGADPEAFTGESGAGRALQASRMLGRHAPVALATASVATPAAADYLTLESVGAAFRSLRRALFPANELPQEALTRDGWQVHPRWDAELAAGTFPHAERIAGSVASVSARYRRELELSPARLALLGRFLEEAKAGGIEVTAFMPPVHPDLVASRAAPSLAAMTAAMDSVLRDAEARGLLRYVRPDRLETDPGKYYDAVHMMAANGDAVLSAIYGGRGASCALQ
ncbi:MAG TPA: hypothetical protein VF037_07040 [Gemmatimonadales bacterium]